MIAVTTLGAVLLGILVYLLFHLGAFVKEYVRSRRMLRKFPSNASSFIFGDLFELSGCSEGNDDPSKCCHCNHTQTAGPSAPSGQRPEFPGPTEAGLAWKRDQVRKFPRTSVMWMMNIPMLSVNHPDSVSVILKSAEPKGPRTYDLLRPWIGDGLLTSHGEKWYRNRRLLTPAFHFDLLKNYVEIKNRCADLLVNKFVKACESGSPLLVFSNVTMYTLDVILKCAMSFETNCQLSGDKHPYVQAVEIMSGILVKRFYEPWFHNDLLFSLTPKGRKFFQQCELVHRVAEKIIRTRQAELESQRPGERSRRGLDFLDTLLTARDGRGQGLTFSEIRDEVDTFLFEGHDTTASAISWTLYSIAGHPDVQTRIQEEVDSALDRPGTGHPDVIWEDLPKLTYLSMVIKEAMRLHSPVPFAQRILTADTEIDGKMAPAGTLVNIVIYSIHHNPTVWPDSLTFDPDRFSPENVEKRHPYSFVPFSAGPRNCIGQNFAMDEIKIIIARILHRVTVRLDPNHTVEKFESVVMRAQNDIRLVVQLRRR